MNESGTQRRQHPVNQVFFGLAFNGCCNGARAQNLKEGTKSAPVFFRSSVGLKSCRTKRSHTRPPARARKDQHRHERSRASLRKRPRLDFYRAPFFQSCAQARSVRKRKLLGLFNHAVLIGLSRLWFDC